MPLKVKEDDELSGSSPRANPVFCPLSVSKLLLVPLACPSSAFCTDLRLTVQPSIPTSYPCCMPAPYAPRVCALPTVCGRRRRFSQLGCALLCVATPHVAFAPFEPGANGFFTATQWLVRGRERNRTRDPTCTRAHAHEYAHTHAYGQAHTRSLATSTRPRHIF
eukprot:4007828-Pleurochrysis_carterae.AAC.5